LRTLPAAPIAPPEWTSIQQAKSWKLRAAMSMARLWRDQEKRKNARELLAPGLWLVYRRVRHIEI